ncbi:MAG: hypothetical protein C5B58_09650 [Acidobacteria bacterium]|nr:MAG: hypothetical protein C5B58_09650 [Acidobacteriota bacterium]
MQLLRTIVLGLWSSFDRFLLVTLTLLAAGASQAAELSSGDSTTAAADQLKALTDPTIVVPSVWLDTEWDHDEHGAEEVTWTLGGLWARRVSERQDWALRLKVPIVYDRSDASSGHANVGGLGDIEVGTGTAFRLSKSWRTGGGIELHADTASNPALGDSVWRLHSTWSVAHDLIDWLTLTFTADYNHSIAEENDVAPQRYLELSLPTTIVLPHDWSISTRYKAKIDFENGDRCTHTADVGVAKRLSSVPVVFSATLEKTFDGGDEKFQVNFTMTYYFQK